MAAMGRGCVKTAKQFMNPAMCSRETMMKRFVEGVARDQGGLFPAHLNDFISEDNPVRAVDAFLEMLDLRKLGFTAVDPSATGRPGYHPGVLLKLYIYGYLNAIWSSRTGLATRLCPLGAARSMGRRNTFVKSSAGFHHNRNVIDCCAFTHALCSKRMPLHFETDGGARNGFCSENYGAMPCSETTPNRGTRTHPADASIV